MHFTIPLQNKKTSEKSPRDVAFLPTLPFANTLTLAGQKLCLQCDFPFSFSLLAYFTCHWSRAMRCPLTSLRYISATESGVPSCVSKHCRAMYLPVADLPNFTLCHPFPDTIAPVVTGMTELRSGLLPILLCLLVLTRVSSNVWQGYCPTFGKVFFNV